MATIQVEKVLFDLGYPDPGHYEYVLVLREKRKTKLWQILFGDKTEYLASYGEDAPSEDQVEKDILRHSK